MKLLDLLFESMIVNSSTITRELRKAFNPLENENDPMVSIAVGNPVDFYQQNKAKFDKITKNATEFKLLGCGAFGCAFSLGGGMVLKLEDVPNRTKKILKHYDSKETEGRYLPMIYDHGTLQGIGDVLTYTVLEKFETESLDNYSDLLTDILDRIRNFTVNFKEADRDVAVVEKYIRRFFNLEDKEASLEQMEVNLRLTSDWLPRLIKDVFALYSKDINDIHIGNIGIRRTGGEGYFVFFD